MTNTNNSQLSVKFGSKDFQKLQKQAGKCNMSIAAYLRKIVAEHLATNN